MKGVKSDFSEKQSEAGILEALIIDLSTKPGSISQVAILKSAFVLLLYNVIESTATALIEKIHERVGRHEYSTLTNELKKLCIDFYVNKQADKNRFEHIEGLHSGSIKLPPLKDFSLRYKLFSGNLDAREINLILKKYGIPLLTSKGKQKLLEIKTKRNLLAHGEEMFKEACRNKTPREIKELKNACFDTMEQMIKNTENFLAEKRYLISP